MHTKPLKWAGSKDGHEEALRPIFNHFRHLTWYDPFCGSLALPFKYSPAQAILKDINPRLINFWKHVQRGFKIPEGICVNDEKHYYEVRDRLNALPLDDDSLESAAYFYYLCRTAYNGLCRFNQKGGFNTPFGRYKAINYMTDFTPYRFKMQGWELSCQSFLGDVIPPDCLLFIDPPYWQVKDRKTPMFVGYAGNVFGWEEQVRVAFKAAHHGGPVICCNSADPQIIELYSNLGFEIRTIQVQRKVSCKGDRPLVTELLAFRNIPKYLLSSLAA
jgi:DNA adenine methylase